MDIRRTVCGIVAGIWVQAAAANGPIEWVDGDKSLCLQTGAIDRSKLRRGYSAIVRYFDRLRAGVLVVARPCDSGDQQVWSATDDGRLEGQHGMLGVIKLRSRILPVATRYPESRYVLPAYYQNGHVVFQENGKDYCLEPVDKWHFSARPLKTCEESTTEERIWLFGQPPEPGEDGLKGLAGVDSDDDGIRDDVQRYIERTLPEEKPKRMAARQFAASQQKVLVVADDREAVLLQEPEMSASVDCLSHSMGNDSTAYLQKMEALIYNTEERIRAWNRINSYFSGMTFTLPADLAAQCDHQ